MLCLSEMETLSGVIIPLLSFQHQHLDARVFEPKNSYRPRTYVKKADSAIPQCFDLFTEPVVSLCQQVPVVELCLVSFQRLAFYPFTAATRNQLQLHAVAICIQLQLIEHRQNDANRLQIMHF